MTIGQLLIDKDIKPKEKTTILSQWLLDKTVTIEEWLDFVQSTKGSAKATCIEALEFATKQTPTVVNQKCLEFVTAALGDKEPRIKWESAKVIGNIAQLFPSKLDAAINNLLVNSEENGTVVRWAAAYAIGEILKLKTPINATLVPTVGAIISREEKDSIKKIYHKALKAIK